jgi:YD repeat-containing protein
MSLFWNSNPSAPFWKTNPSSLFWLNISANFTYDLLGRLTEVTYADGSTIVYNYDKMGNRTSVVITRIP